MNTDRIEKTVELRAPVERVWRALTDAKAFGQWFGVKLEADFEVGETSRGHITYPGYEHVRWESVVVAMDPMRLFAFTWHPYAIDPAVDYSAEPSTRVTFTLEPTAAGTRLTVVETGFDALPPERRSDALRMNDSGWAEQCRSIAAYLDAHAPAESAPAPSRRTGQL